MNNPSAEEAYTTVENMTGGERVFGFLGTRGMRLGPNEVVAIPGDLVASLGMKAHHGGRRRQFDAMERALEAGHLRINSRPAPILYDVANEAPASLAVVAGVLGVVDPSYTLDSSSSSSSSV
jgi:hypothetical protein